MPKKSPIGVDDFSKLILKENDYLFVDKTLFIKEILDDGLEVSLILRPRRWGKTLNMSMLRYFFAPQVEGRSTKGLFDQLNIAKESDGAYLVHQGTHPVILISFKGVKEDSFELFLSNISVLLARLYREHHETLRRSTKLSGEQKNAYTRIIDRKADQAELQNALQFLSECLEKHYNQKVIILIDEYDTPLNIAYEKGYFEKAVGFFKNLLGAALKGNGSLEKGIMTGILRLSKNKMLSDLNNLFVYSLIDKQYSHHFGFSEKEVKQLFAQSDVPLDLPTIQKWYNGYRSGDLLDIYNPWSVLSCITKDGELHPYWVMTADDALLKEAFAQMSPALEEQLTRLLEGKSIDSSMDDYVSFEQIKQYGQEALWSLLWATGYLKWVEKPSLSALGKYTGSLKIPNEEISYSYRVVFPKWVRAFNRVHYDSFLNNLAHGQVDAFIQDLRNYFLSVPSWFDFQKESDYHAFSLGLLASLQETHEMLSNKEIGLGRPDLVLIPKEKINPLGLILEFKREAQGKTLEHYAQCASKGLEQINKHYYDIDLKSKTHIKQLLKLCIVFHGKAFEYKFVLETVA